MYNTGQLQKKWKTVFICGNRMETWELSRWKKNFSLYTFLNLKIFEPYDCIIY